MFKKDNTYCCVPQCNSMGSRNPELSFHKFPCTPNKPNSPNFSYAARSSFAYRRKRNWIRLLRIGKEVSHRMRVCSKHFKENDYSKPCHKSPKSKSRLKPFAVPSLYLPVTDYSEKRTKKYQEDLKKNSCNKVSNRSVSHSLTASQKSTLLNKAVNKLEFDPIEASEKDLRLSTIDLWQKNEALKKNIKCLQNEGYKEDELKRYTDTLEKHQYIKDLAMRVMERLAAIENTTIEKVQEDFDMTGL